MRNVVIAILVVVAAAAGYIYFKARGVQQAAVKWEGAVPEIVSENIQKDRDTTKIELASRIDAPVDAVFDAFEQPEKAQGMVDEIKMAKVVSGDDKKKTVEFHITTLGQLQVFTVDLSYDKAANEVGIKTVEGVIDIDGSYKLDPSPDGKRTLVTYKATQKNKLPLPVPEAVERSAIKEQFANLMKAIKKTLQQEGKLVGDAGTARRLAA
jgi:polyketide cyclase/dehydrase/lipid transport protein